MNNIVYVDVETTSVRPDRRAWDIALITPYDDGRPDWEWQAYVRQEDLALGDADARALAVGQFHQRHPEFTNSPVLDGGGLISEVYAMQWVELITRGKVLVGHNVAFDIATLGARMRACGVCPSWDYHYVEVSSLVAGWSLGAGDGLGAPPWKFEQVCAAAGVTQTGLHTALGDAAMVRQVHRAVLGEAAAPWRAGGVVSSHIPGLSGLPPTGDRTAHVEEE